MRPLAIVGESLAVSLKAVEEAGELGIISEGHYRLVGCGVKHSQIRWSEIFRI